MNKKKPSLSQVAFQVTLTLLGFGLFLGLALLMLRMGGERPTYEEKRMQERLEKLKTHQAKDQELLETYGWVNESAAVARIPIERAMALMARDLAKKEVKAAGPVNPPPTPAAVAPSEPATPSVPAAPEGVKQ